MNLKYAEKLKDPRWQKIRLEVFQRDEWTCDICLDDQSTLHVHHKIYQSGRDPWEYDLDSLVTLCEGCHFRETNHIKDACSVQIDQLKIQFFSQDLLDFAFHISKANYIHIPSLVLSAIGFALSDEKAQSNLLDSYFDHLKEERRKICEQKELTQTNKKLSKTSVDAV